MDDLNRKGQAIAPPRYVADQCFPPYTYVPGQQPHPITDPAGHSYGHEPGEVAAPIPSRPFESRPFLVAVDLYNHGYYWEAHEEWEQLWHACGRSGITADFLKGLIKLAAAGVKQLEGRPVGVTRHLARARELFAATQQQHADSNFLGLSLEELAGVDQLPSGLELRC